MEKWVAAQLAALDDADAPGVPTRFRATFGALGGADPPIKVTPQFMDLLAAKCSKLFPAKLGDAKSDEAALALAIVLARIPSAATTDGLVACLEHANMGVRYWGAEGLRRNRAHMTEEARAQAARLAVAALGKAGADEINPIVLGKVYAAFDFAASGNKVPASLIQETVKAAETVLEARIKAYKAKRTGAAAADATVPQVLVNLWLHERTPDPEKRRLLGLVSQLFQASTALFVASPPAGQADLAPVIAACEGELRRACVKSDVSESLPKVAPLLKGNSPNQIKLEGLKWWGSKDVKGVLNGPPFNVPVLPPFAFEGPVAPAAPKEGGGN